MLPDYAELHCVSNHSFLRGASHPQELIARALALGYRALALTDDCSMGGVVRAHLALRDARKHPDTAIAALAFKLIIGSEFTVIDPQGQTVFRLIALAMDRQGHGDLCEFITRVRRASPDKGRYQLLLPELTRAVQAGVFFHCQVLMALPRPSLSEAEPMARLLPLAQWLHQHLSGRSALALSLHHSLDDAFWLRTLRALSQATGLPLVATGDVLMHVRSRKPLQDVLVATDQGLALPDCGLHLERHAERHLRTRLRLSQRYPHDTLQAAVDMAACCHFSLDELRYEYPEEVVPEGLSPAEHLRQLTLEGSQERFPQGMPESVQDQIEHELALISEMGYEKYFLTVYDIVRFARSQGILCQGRGSAANSAVCYCLHITEVDPSRASLMFERFISRERNEPPDIDVDFEHQRREEVIQYLYAKYGRDRTALTATCISYQRRSAMRDVGKALGFSLEQVELACGNLHWRDGASVMAERLLEVGLDAQERRVQQWIELTHTMIGFPRHLSQHTGGFVIARDLLCRMVPIENAAMPDRSVIQWDKDDLDALGLLKVDVLALGMLTAIKHSLAFITQLRGGPPDAPPGTPFRMQDIPSEDPATYEMACQADTIGVFQIESRAQMSMLPRLQPRRFYDLIIEVALVRPGPIQGGMVHPYLKRRQGIEPVSYPPGLEAALGRTLGIPIFQEQVMQVAVIAARFSPGEADALRRAMAAWRRRGEVDRFHRRIVQGMTARGYSAEFAEQIFKQIEGFGSYGFPESHAASFALLVYTSAWIKCHEPAAFLAGLLNAQPLGFYTPSQLVQDARRHGVEVRAPDVQHSDWACTLEAASPEHLARATHPRPQPAVRLGLRLVAHLSVEAVRRIEQARQPGPFADVESLTRRARLTQNDVRALAAADALQSLAGHRRQQVWQASAQHHPPELLQDAPVHEAPLHLPAPPEGEDIVFDHAALGLSLRRHPLALLRPQLAKERLLNAAQMHDFPSGRLARACGIVTVRQQPGTASGVVFVTLEDETGNVNVIVWASLRDKQRHVLIHARLLAVYGVWQREGEVRHLIAHHLRDMTPLLGTLRTISRDFR